MRDTSGVPARSTMAPVAFYPAVDNPEYFHMTAQNVGLGELPQMVSENSPQENGQHDLEKAASVQRKNSLTSDNGHELNPRNVNDVSFGDAIDRREAELSTNESDSDEPPEVPPRSEATSSNYVNSPSFNSSVNSRNPFLGEYLYTKTEMPQNAARVPPGTARVVPGAATVVSPSGIRSVHNALYRSFPAAAASWGGGQRPNVSPKLHLPPPPPPSTDLPLPESPAPPVPSLSPSNGPPPCSRSDCGSPEIAAQGGGGGGGSSLLSSSFSSNSSVQTKISMEELRTSELKKIQATEQRMKEEETASAERERLDEILAMCAEYDRQQLSGVGSPAGTGSGSTLDSFASGSTPSPLKHQYSSSTLTQNRIKTNGSLPREKRSPHISAGVSPPPQMGLSSPPGTLPPLSPSTPNSLHRAGTPSEDELSSIFSFEGDFFKNNNSLTRNGMVASHPPSYPPHSLGLLNTPSPPPPTPRSPYENVSPPYHSLPHPYPAVPQSPRTRIRTTLAKDHNRRTAAATAADNSCEIFENKFALSDFNLFPSSGANYIGSNSDSTGASLRRPSSRSPERSTFTESPENSFNSAPPKPPRSPRIQRGVLYDCHIGNQSAKNGPHHSASVIDNKYFASVTPKHRSKLSDSVPLDAEPSESEKSTPDLSDDQFDLSSPEQKSSYYQNINDSFSNRFEYKVKNKFLEEQMIKNIQETLQIDDVPGELDRLNVEKTATLHALTDLKIQVNEIERQEGESLRELEMERALLAGELASTRAKVGQEEEKLANLVSQSDEMDKRHAEERKNDSETIERYKTRLEKAEDDLEETESKNEGFIGTTDEETEMLEILKSQHETVEAERKIFEDTEFSQMESEAHRESEREELNKEISELSDKIFSRKQKISELENQVCEMTSSVCKETEGMESQRQELLSRMSKEGMRLSSLERQLGALARLGVLSTNGQSSPCSSDTEESYAPELTERLANLHLLDRSQEDLDRISQVTTSSPLGCSDASLGRKTSATLMEIERNRQLMLAKQGAMTIDNERRRVEELKRRVADEVKAKWEERKAREKREVNCASLNSIGSEDSSMTSSDLHTESISSDDVTVPRSSGENGNNFSYGLKMRQRGSDAQTPGGDDILRPVSDASSCCDPDSLSFVRFRDKTKAQQRPLTRYLPVRPEIPFDLRQHIESAGHQIELCPHLKINSICCRGYLHKLGSKFKTWQKRWFVFDRSKRTFVYYSDKSELKPKGGATFQEIEEVYVNHLSHSADSLTFCVKSHERTFQLLARSPEAMRIWIDVIFTGAEGYREFRGGT